MTVEELYNACEQLMDYGKGDYNVVVNAVGFDNLVTDWFDEDKNKRLLIETEKME